MIRGVTIRIDCEYCDGKGRVRGGQVQFGEVVACPICLGSGTTADRLKLEELRDLLLGVRREEMSDLVREKFEEMWPEDAKAESKKRRM